MESTRRFFERSTTNGAEIWTRVRDTIVIVLATPNGWSIREQATLRKAAVMASLVPEENASQLLQFVTEAEASVHYALTQDPGKWLKERTVFAVIDCGGFTVDTTIYRCVSTHPLGLAEACPSECVQVVQFIVLSIFAAINVVTLIFPQGRRHLRQPRVGEDVKKEARWLLIRRSGEYEKHDGRF